VVGKGNSTRRGLVGVDVGDVLVEGRRALDGRLVVLGVLPDGVGLAIGLEGALVGGLGGTLAVAGVLLDVVLNERVGRPAVESDEDGAAVGLGLTAVGEDTARTLLETMVGRDVLVFVGNLQIRLAGGITLADDKVRHAVERDRVAAALRRELDRTASLVVLVVVELALAEVVQVAQHGLGTSKLEVRLTAVELDNLDRWCGCGE
jgi:hypothetical protein